MPHLLLIFSQSGKLIQMVDINSYTEWQTVQIQISWLLQKPADLDLHCLQNQDLSVFSRTRGNEEYLVIILGYFFLFLHKNICCGYSLEGPHQGTSNEYLQHMFLWRIEENYPIIITQYSYLTNPLSFDDCRSYN